MFSSYKTFTTSSKEFNVHHKDSNRLFYIVTSKPNIATFGHKYLFFMFFNETLQIRTLFYDHIKHCYNVHLYSNTNSPEITIYLSQTITNNPQITSNVNSLISSSFVWSGAGVLEARATWRQKLIPSYHNKLEGHY